MNQSLLVAHGGKKDKQSGIRTKEILDIILILFLLLLVLLCLYMSVFGFAAFCLLCFFCCASYPTRVLAILARNIARILLGSDIVILTSLKVVLNLIYFKFNGN